MEKPQHLLRYKRFFPLILFFIFAGLLTSCDYAAWNYYTVNQIVIVNEIPYVHALERVSMGLNGVVEKENHYFFSQDYGNTWNEISLPPVEMSRLIEKLDENQYELPYNVRKTTCVPGDLAVCYRIVGKEQVEISTDAGATWRIDWKMPLGRKTYMAKNPKIVKYVEVEPDAIPYDLGVISKGEGHYVIVAMGNQGVLVKTPDDVWNRYTVSATSVSTKLATPLPYYAKNLKDAIKSLEKEINMSLLATYFFFLSMSIVRWKRLYSKVAKINQKKLIWAYTPFLLTTGGPILLFLFLIVLILFDVMEIVDYLPIYPELFCVMPYIGLVASWLVLIFFFLNDKNFLFFSLASLEYIVIFFFGIMLPFILWAFGIIPIYEIALSMAVIFGFLTFIWAIWDKRWLKIQ